MDADLAIARLAATQHGVAARAQLLAAGIPRHVIDYRLAKGLLEPVHAGVYRLAAAAPTWHQRIIAATLSTSGVASHRAAAFLHGLDGIEPRPEVTVARRRAPAASGVTVHRLGFLVPSDVETRDEIPRTRAAATLLGLAAVVPVVALEAALDDALARGLVSCRQLQRRLDSAGRQGRTGAGALAALLDERSPHPRWSQSEFERRLLRLLTGAGLPPPVPQYEVVLPDGRKAFLDFAWPEVRLAVEADSYRHHSSRRDWGRDHIRNNLLISLGWRILPVTWDDMVRRPGEVVSLLERARAA